jgi:hypothetical protein
MKNLKKSLIDGETIINKAIFDKIIDSIIELQNYNKTDNANNSDYCNFHHNLGAISEFLIKYRLKEVDEFNQLTICMAGDSIFGRVDKGSAWNENKPQISYTPDLNNPLETLPGYKTGHFPPNMWEMTVPYKTLELLQWETSDVKYFNHSSSEIIKSNNWTDGYPIGADSTRAVYTSTVGADITLTFTNSSFAKVVFHNYSAATSKDSRISILFSIDDGNTWKSPKDLNIISSENVDCDSTGEYQLSSDIYKWPNICFRGLDKSMSYKIKVTNKSSTRVSVWGFETWNNPRMNVIVVAEGGNTATSQLSSPQRFYSKKYYNQSLVIYELPFLNDLGSGPLAKFKNKIKLNSIAPTNPSEADFYYCEETGIYENFNNISAIKGEYIEYYNGGWRLGSTKLNSVIKDYKNKNYQIFNRLSQQGVPVIAIITHAGTYDLDRPFGYELGIPILRDLVSSFGFAILDINNYQRISGKYTQNNNVIHADGTHLNDNGVKMYMDLISLLFNIPVNSQFCGTYTKYNRPLCGIGRAGEITKFGFEFSKAPNVIIQPTTESEDKMCVVNVDESGFEVLGTGEFKYIAQIL